MGLASLNFTTLVFTAFPLHTFTVILTFRKKKKTQKNPHPLTFLLSLLTPALISSTGCRSGSQISEALLTALLTFFRASDLIHSLSPYSHGAQLVHCGRATVSFGGPCLLDFLSPHQICLCVLRW